MVRTLPPLKAKTQEILEGSDSVASKELAESLARKQQFLATYLKRQGAIDAVERILKYGSTEKKLPLQDLPWFRDQLRLIADWRIKSLLCSGASQISKTLGNVCVLADALVYGQIDVGYFFDSRDNLYNNQPQQIQPILEHYIEKLGESREKVKREATARFNFGIASGYFFYVTGQSKEAQGGAAESSKVASVSISAAWCEEYASWGNVDISPRLGASSLISRPQRKLGTPGSGSGMLDRDMKQARYLFCPAVFCSHCGELAFLDPKGALLKPVAYGRDGAAAIDVLQDDPTYRGRIIPTNPVASKAERAYEVVPQFERGEVWLPDPSLHPWVKPLLNELELFPKSATDDCVDAMTQLLSQVKSAGVGNVISVGRPRDIYITMDGF
jgi:hypothetical protein